MEIDKNLILILKDFIERNDEIGLRKYINKHGFYGTETIYAVGIAVQRGHLSILKYLVDCGLDLQCLKTEYIVDAMCNEHYETMMFLWNNPHPVRWPNIHQMLGAAKSREIFLWAVNTFNVTVDKLCEFWIDLASENFYCSKTDRLERTSKRIELLGLILDNCDIASYIFCKVDRRILVFGEYWILVLSRLTDLEVEDENGMTPLMYFAETQYLSIVKYLLSRGAHLYKNGVLKGDSRRWTTHAKSIIDLHIKKHLKAKEYLLEYWKDVQRCQNRRSYLLALPYICLERIQDFMIVE